MRGGDWGRDAGAKKGEGNEGGGTLSHAPPSIRTFCGQRKL